MPLKINLNSFSYKYSGVPFDTTGNGGGFVFDCRFIPNPGRIEKFKSLTGKDKAVIKFLNREKEMKKFLKNVFRLIEPAVSDYIKRDFTNLMINFGCTGGIHRSVYSAEKTMKHLKKKFPYIVIELHHIQLEKTTN